MLLAGLLILTHTVNICNQWGYTREFKMAAAIIHLTCKGTVYTLFTIIIELLMHRVEKQIYKSFSNSCIIISMVFKYKNNFVFQSNLIDFKVSTKKYKKYII